MSNQLIKPGYIAVDNTANGYVLVSNGTFASWSSVVGYAGSQGTTGYAGSVGYAGSTGSTGYTGSAGTNGTNGINGTTGYTGSAGPVAGSDTQVIFNDGGFANGSSGLTYNKSTQTLTIGNNLYLGGNIYIAGNVTTFAANNLDIVDNMIYLNSNSEFSNPDIGFAANYNDGTYHHTGFFRDHATGVWKVFENYLPEPQAAQYIDQSNNTFRLANFQANTVYANAVSSNTLNINNGFITVGNSSVNTQISQSTSSFHNINLLSNAATFNSYSTYLSSSSVTTSWPTTALNCAGNGFTVEFFVKFNSLTSSLQRITDNGTAELGISVSTTTITIDDQGYSTVGSVTGLNLQNNVWYHFAYIGKSNDTYFAINGAVTDLGVKAGHYGSGTWGAGFGNLNGPATYSNFRVVTGQIVYDTNGFTPPTSPLTAITGTYVLTLQSATFVDNSGSNRTISTSGSPSLAPDVISVSSSSYYTAGTIINGNINSPIINSNYIYANNVLGSANQVLASNSTGGIFWSSAAGAGYTGSSGAGYTGSVGSTGGTGYTGSAGTSGSVGYTGSSGTGTGYTGSSGAGYTGSAGTSGSLGYTGSAGFTGSVGYTGSQGSQGAVGYTGSIGSVGYTGSQGIQGTVGYSGSIGSQGTVGYSGSQGVIGYAGSLGYTGSQGTVGYAGSQGVIGYSGSQGIQGVVGYTGSLGIGYAGSSGYVGSSGSVGYTGSIGIGYTGSAGSGTGGFANGQSIQVANLTISGTLFDNANTYGAANTVLTSNGAGGVYWAAPTGGTGSGSGYTGSQGFVGYTGSSGSTIGLSGNTQTFVGNGTANTFIMNSVITSSPNIIVTINGLLQIPTTHYYVSGANLNFYSPPSSDRTIEVRSFSGTGFTGSIGSTGYAGSTGSLGYTGSIGAGYTGSAGTSSTQLTQQGVLVPTTGTVRWYAPGNSLVITNAVARVLTAPQGSPVVATVRKNGTAASIISIASGTNKASNNTTINMSGTTDDYLTLDVTSVGVSSPGSDLYITITYSIIS